MKDILCCEKDIPNCQIEEVIDKANRNGVIGFIKSGYGALKGKTTNIERTRNDVSKYDMVIIGTPVWAGHVSCAIRTYIYENRSKLKEVAFFSTQMGADQDKVFDDLKSICRLNPKATLRLLGNDIKNNECKSKISNFIDAIK